MSKRKRRDDDGDETAVDRIMTTLERAPAGLHDLGVATVDVPIDWPPTVSDVYLAFDGGTLFGDLLTLVPAAEAPDADDDGLVAIGELMGDGVWFDVRGRVWRADPHTGERVIDGTRFDRWLHGVIDGLARIYDDDGEFAEDAFTDDGELTDAVATAMLHAQLKRDARAPGPRWRLARALTAEGELTAAREQLEDVVAAEPALAWAWMDLARISEKLGELAGAIDEAEQASAARPDHELAGYFLAEAARLAAKAGDEPRRADLAARALARDPELVRDRVAAAATSLDAGELDDAAHLAALARALAPRDLAVLDLARRIDAAREQQLT
jgi:tetratricopeptide (TPR) repeat protein